MGSFWTKFKIASRFMLPSVMVFFLILLSAVNFRMPGSAIFIPMFATMGVFYWGLYWPGVMPKWLVFIIGIFQDTLYGTPLGVSSLGLLLLWWAVVSQRRFLVSQPFYIIWPVFIVVAGGLSLLYWLIFTLYFRQDIPADVALMQWVFTILLYPLLHTLFNTIHVLFIKPL